VKFLKPLASGVAAVIIAALILSTPLLAVMLRYPAKDGYYFVIHWHGWSALCVSVLIFSVGFFWQYRKAR
jgi:hypothetical protein